MPAAAAATPRPARRRATGSRRPAVVAACRVTGTALAHVVLRLRVTGRAHVPPSGAVLLAGNHSGLLDGPLVFFVSPRPSVVLTKSEVFVGAGARFFGWLGCVPVHRGAPDRAALRAALDALARGEAVAVFPEGTRGTGSLDQVADGLAYLALRSGAPVVPIAVSGTADALPKGRVLPRWRTPVRITFGPPIALDVPGDPRARSTVRTAAEQLRLGLLDHLHTSTQEAS